MRREVEVPTPLSTDSGRTARVEEVMRDAFGRLRGVCSHLSDEQFDALLRQIAEVTVKYEALAELRAARVDTPPDAFRPLVNAGQAPPRSQSR